MGARRQGALAPQLPRATRSSEFQWERLDRSQSFVDCTAPEIHANDRIWINSNFRRMFPAHTHYFVSGFPQSFYEKSTWIVFPPGKIELSQLSWILEPNLQEPGDRGTPLKNNPQN